MSAARPPAAGAQDPGEGPPPRRGRGGAPSAVGSGAPAARAAVGAAAALGAEATKCAATKATRPRGGALGQVAGVADGDPLAAPGVAGEHEEVGPGAPAEGALVGLARDGGGDVAVVPVRAPGGAHGADHLGDGGDAARVGGLVEQAGEAGGVAAVGLHGGHGHALARDGAEVDRVSRVLGHGLEQEALRAAVAVPEGVHGVEVGEQARGAGDEVAAGQPLQVAALGEGAEGGPRARLDQVGRREGAVRVVGLAQVRDAGPAGPVVHLAEQAGVDGPEGVEAEGRPGRVGEEFGVARGGDVVHLALEADRVGDAEAVAQDAVGVGEEVGVPAGAVSASHAGARSPRPWRACRSRP